MTMRLKMRFISNTQNLEFLWNRYNKYTFSLPFNFSGKQMISHGTFFCATDININIHRRHLFFTNFHYISHGFSRAKRRNYLVHSSYISVAFPHKSINSE